MTRPKLISVIVPHLNQESYLAIGLAALNAQQGVEIDVEIIVVDNGSARLPEEACAKWANVRLVSELTPGPGPARNCGAKLAKGEILAFIDADCCASEHWLAAIERAFQNQATDIIGGDVQVRYENPQRPMFHEPYEAIYSYRNDEHIAEGFSGTGNLATRPEVLSRVGPFAGIKVAEDRDWGLRAGALGYHIHYREDMIVYHPARPTFADLTLKWDRHIAHDFNEVRGLTGRARWILRALAVAASPAAETLRVMSSKRVMGLRERVMAWACLARIRLYRSWRMLGVMVENGGTRRYNGWNRQ